VQDKQGSRVPWVLLFAGLAAAAAVLILLMSGGRLPTLGGSTQALATEIDPNVLPGVATEGAASFNVKLPGLGNLSLGEVTPGYVSNWIWLLPP
jgi:hypothetical protein